MKDAALWKRPAEKFPSFRSFQENPPPRSWKKFPGFDFAMRFLMLNWRDPKNPISGGAERVTLAHLAALVERGHRSTGILMIFGAALPKSCSTASRSSAA